MHEVQFAYEDGFALSVPRLEIAEGEAVALVGPSGCGKTTLLALVAGILVPCSGDIQVCGERLSAALERARRRFRLRHIGLVFQDDELIDYLPVRENILLPCWLARSAGPTAREAAARLAAAMGIAGRLERYPHQLSHGERQRAALCRALISDPPVLLADEPTSALDAENTRRLLDALLEAVRERGRTLLLLTHDVRLLERFDRVIDVTAFGTGAPV